VPAAGRAGSPDDRLFRLTQDFLEVTTDDGIPGVAGPLRFAPVA